MLNTLTAFILVATAFAVAPGPSSKKISDSSYVLAFAKGDEVIAGLENFARENQIKGAHFHGLGALRSVSFGWFDEKKKKYLPHHIDSPVEVTSLNGDIALSDGKPIVHAHINVADSAGNTHGGHLLNATVFPTLEVFVDVYPVALHKQLDSETGLKLFDLTK